MWNEMSNRARNTVIVVLLFTVLFFFEEVDQLRISAKDTFLDTVGTGKQAPTKSSFRSFYAARPAPTRAAPDHVDKAKSVWMQGDGESPIAQPEEPAAAPSEAAASIETPAPRKTAAPTAAPAASEAAAAAPTQPPGAPAGGSSGSPDPSATPDTSAGSRSPPIAKPASPAPRGGLSDIIIRDAKPTPFLHPHRSGPSSNLGAKSPAATQGGEPTSSADAEMPEVEDFKQAVEYPPELEYESLGHMRQIAVVDLAEGDNLQKAVAARSFNNELILISTNLKMGDLALNMIENLRALRLDHYLLIASNDVECEALGELIDNLACVWTSLPRHIPAFNRDLGGEMEQQQDTWALWTVRKYYVGKIASLGYNVFQTDTDVVWWENPYPTLKTLMKGHGVIMQAEGNSCPRANGGVIYIQNNPALAPEARGAAAFIMSQVPARVFYRIQHPEYVNELIPGLIGDVTDRMQTEGWIRAVTDEQDLLNDSILSGMVNRSVSFLSLRAAAAKNDWIKAGGVPHIRYHLGKEKMQEVHQKAWKSQQEAIQAWTDDHKIDLNWYDIVATTPIPGPDKLCQPSTFYTKTVRYRPVYKYMPEEELRDEKIAAEKAAAQRHRRLLQGGVMKLGAQSITVTDTNPLLARFNDSATGTPLTPGLVSVEKVVMPVAPEDDPNNRLPKDAETAANTPVWLFGGQDSLRHISGQCPSTRLVERQRYADMIRTKLSIVSHLVGLGSHDGRETIMRVTGAWNYYPSDRVHNQFPLNAQRVLALNPAGPVWGMTMDREEYIPVMIRRLAALALLSGRIPVVPLMDCVKFGAAPDIMHLPCPKSPVGCCYYIPGDPCKRDQLAAQPDLEYLLTFLDPKHVASVRMEALYEGGAGDSRNPRFRADNWESIDAYPKLSGPTTLPADSEPGKKALQFDDRRAVDAQHVKELLTLKDKTVVFLEHDSLALGNGTELFQDLPGVLHNLEPEDDWELGFFRCPPLAEGRYARADSTWEPKDGVHERYESQVRLDAKAGRSPALEAMAADYRNGSYRLHHAQNVMRLNEELPLALHLQRALRSKISAASAAKPAASGPAWNQHLAEGPRPHKWTEQGEHYLRKITDLRYPGGNLDKPGLLEIVAKNRTKGGEIVVVAGDQQAMQAMKHLYANLQALGIHHTILVTSRKQLCDELVVYHAGAACGYTRRFFDNAFPAAQRIQVSESHHSGLAQLYMTQELVSLGYNVLSLRPTAHLHVDPYPILKSTFKDYAAVMMETGDHRSPVATEIMYFQNAAKGGPVDNMLRGVTHRMELLFRTNEPTKPGYEEMLSPGAEDTKAHKAVKPDWIFEAVGGRNRTVWSLEAPPHGGLWQDMLYEQAMLNDGVSSACSGKLVLGMSLLRTTREELRGEWMKSYMLERRLRRPGDEPFPLPEQLAAPDPQWVGESPTPERFTPELTSCTPRSVPEPASWQVPEEQQIQGEGPAEGQERLTMAPVWLFSRWTTEGSAMQGVRGWWSQRGPPTSAIASLDSNNQEQDLLAAALGWNDPSVAAKDDVDLENRREDAGTKILALRTSASFSSYEDTFAEVEKLFGWATALGRVPAIPGVPCDSAWIEASKGPEWYLGKNWRMRKPLKEWQTAVALGRCPAQTPPLGPQAGAGGAEEPCCHLLVEPECGEVAYPSWDLARLPAWEPQRRLLDPAANASSSARIRMSSIVESGKVEVLDGDDFAPGGQGGGDGRAAAVAGGGGEEAGAAEVPTLEAKDVRALLLDRPERVLYLETNQPLPPLNELSKAVPKVAWMKHLGRVGACIEGKGNK